MDILTGSLKSEAKANRQGMSEVSAVTEAQRLLASNGAEDMNMLREMGMHKSVELATELHANRMELENLEKKYGKVFSIKEIKNVACKYALMFKRSDTYRGAIDPAMLQSIKAFFAENGMESNTAQMGYKFYVLAPASSFELEENPRPPKDPILFYKLDEDNYRLIHKWGADFTPFRRIMGFKYSNVFGYLMTWLFTLSIPAMILTIMNHWISDASKGNIGVVTSFSIVLYVAAAIIAAVRTFDDDCGGYFRPWHKIWKGNEEPKF